MQEQRQDSVGRIGHPLSAAALLLHTFSLPSDAELHVSRRRVLFGTFQALRLDRFGVVGLS